jgi:hypothetical protein
MQSQSDANAAFFELMRLQCPDKAYRVCKMLKQHRKHPPETVSIDINSRDDHGDSALRLAISESNVVLVKVLLYYGADCNLVTLSEENKISLLHCAMRSHEAGLELMGLLLDRGVSACEITSNGKTSLHTVCDILVGDREERLKLLLDNIPPRELPRLLSSRAGTERKKTTAHICRRYRIEFLVQLCVHY